MEIKVSIDPSLLKLSKRNTEGIELGLKVCAAHTQTNIKQLPPNESFIDRTAHLRTSIKMGNLNKEALKIDVTAHAEYGIFVNDGTKYIRARRFMERGLDKSSREFPVIMNEQINRSLNRG